MSLVSMKSSGVPMEGVLATGPQEEYPYGLCVTLNEEQINKLGLTYLPAAGEVIMIEAKATVKSVMTNNSLEGGQSRRVELQITDMELGSAPEAEGPSAAKVLYEMEDM